MQRNRRFPMQEAHIVSTGFGDEVPIRSKFWRRSQDPSKKSKPVTYSRRQRSFKPAKFIASSGLRNMGKIMPKLSQKFKNRKRLMMEARLKRPTGTDVFDPPYNEWELHMYDRRIYGKSIFYENTICLSGRFSSMKSFVWKFIFKQASLS